MVWYFIGVYNQQNITWLLEDTKFLIPHRKYLLCVAL